MTLRIVVVPADADVVGVEDVAQLVADQVDDRLEVELGGHALLDRVDHRQLGRALLGFLEQPLRLVEQARVLECHAHAVRQRAQQAQVGLRRTHRAGALDADRTISRAVAQQRHTEERLVQVARGIWRGDREPTEPLLLRDAPEHQGLPRVDDDLAQPASGVGPARHPAARRAIGVVWLDKQVVRRVVKRDEGCVGREDFADLVADEVDDGLEVQLGRQPS